jgi:molecular chaperone GrpE
MASRIVQYSARQAFQRMSHVAAVPTTRSRIAPLASTCFTHVRVFSDTKGTEEAPKEDPAAAQEAAPPASEEEPREIQLEKQVIDLKDQLLRSLAEQENTRRIAKRDVESARNFAIKSFAKSLLDTSDNLALALDAVPEELRSDKEGNAVLANLYEGIQMTQMGLDKAFEQNGLKRYGEVGDVFDPNHHEALFQYPDPNLEAGTIGQVMKKGFFLNKRVLRPAEVGVIKN